MGSVSSSDNNVTDTDTMQDFHLIYELGEKLGDGSFASVYKCFRKSDLKKFAVKMVDKLCLDEREIIGLKNEVRILKQVSNKNIIKLIDIIQDKKYVFIVLELCDGKDLFDQIIESKNHHFKESKAAEIMYILSNALQYLHEHGIVHRDLKPENILFSIDGTLKITDFGLAHYEILSSSDDSSFDLIYMNEHCGTPHYVAPEILMADKYNYKCDLFALGIILYIMLVGYHKWHNIFNGKSFEQTYFLIAKGKYNINCKEWNNISNEAKDLIKCLLETDPNKRYSEKDVKSHPFIIKNVH